MKSDPQILSADSNRPVPLLERLSAFYELTKPRVVALIIFTAVVGMFLAVPLVPPLVPFVFGTLGIGLAAAAGAAINHLLDREADSQMSRTSGRPLVKGNLTPTEAFTFALILIAISMFVLVAFVNTLTAVLTFASLIGYAVIYTVYLKHATPQNIVIGGAAGAAPPLLGWVAMTGEVSSDALLLFMIIFAWTPPHFWALALYRHKEYAKADIPMLPVTHGSRFTRLHIVLYSILLAAVTTMPFATKMSGLFYLVGACILNSIFLSYAVRLYLNYSDALARKTFSWSIQYLGYAVHSLVINPDSKKYVSGIGKTLLGVMCSQYRADSSGA